MRVYCAERTAGIPASHFKECLMKFIHIADVHWGMNPDRQFLIKSLADCRIEIEQC